jgi:hypothetical protein
MTEYPSIPNSSKAPKKPCIAFEKLDGSNMRVKWTQKKGFALYGSRTQLIDNSHPELGGVIDAFKRDYEAKLEDIIRKNFRSERELVVFGEYKGPNSFAGTHTNEAKTFTMFDVLVGHKNAEFLLPQEFIKLFSNKLEIPRVIYKGNMNESLIKDVRDGKYDVFEGVICKGTERTHQAPGGVWMCKIKTQRYFDLLKERYGEAGLKLYGE